MPRLLRIFPKLATTFAIGALVAGMQHPTDDLASRVLATHNRERAAVGVPALRWNEELARGAQDWADHLAATGKFEHSPNLPGQPLEGENIWGGTPDAFAPELMVGLWIAEKTHFVPGTFPHNSKTGAVEDVSHYTQLIWRETASVGCAISEGASEEILVCRYSTPGNVKGRRPI